MDIKRRIRIFGLSLLAALGLASITAIAAQAGEYRVEGKSFTTHKLTSETVTGTVAAGKLLVPGLALTIECTSGDASGTVLVGGVAHAVVLYLGCKVAGNKFCTVYPTALDVAMETNKGDLTASGLGKLVLMSLTKNGAGEEVAPFTHYLLLEENGAPFTNVFFNGGLCTLTSGEPVSGSTLFELPNALKEEVTQSLVNPGAMALELLFPSDTLKYGNQAATLDEGNASASLSGALKGKTWGAE